jgi:hypothetical protein
VCKRRDTRYTTDGAIYIPFPQVGELVLLCVDVNSPSFLALNSAPPYYSERIEQIHQSSEGEDRNFRPSA